MGDFIGSVATRVLDIMQAGGYFGVAMLVLLENLIPPIPSTAILPFAGFLAGQGRLALPWVVAAATTASIVAAVTLYSLGRWLGEERLRDFIGRFGGWLLLKQADVDRAQGWFDRHGGPAVVVGHLIPFGRGLIAIPAGVARMPVGMFALYAAIGSGLWDGLLIGLGWALGWHWPLVSRYVEVLGWPALLAGVAAAAWFGWRHRREVKDRLPAA